MAHAVAKSSSIPWVPLRGPARPWAAAVPAAAWAPAEAEDQAEAYTAQQPEARDPVTPALAVLGSLADGLVLAPAEDVPRMLKADWCLFLELVCYAVAGVYRGSIAYGIEEVVEAVSQGVVSVLFMPTACGSGGEAAVKQVALHGGRGYMVGPSHELYQDMNAWGSAAILFSPITRPTALEQVALARSSKRSRKESQPAGDSTPVKMKAELGTSPGPVASLGASPEPPGSSALGASPRPVARGSEKELGRCLHNLGRKDVLKDSASIPDLTERVRNEYLPGLGAATVFAAFAVAFSAARSVAHRKAIVYVANELLVRRRAVMASEDRLAQCLLRLFKPIGKAIRAFKAGERESYCRLVALWQKAKVFNAEDLAELKEAWDVD